MKYLPWLVSAVSLVAQSGSLFAQENEEKGVFIPEPVIVVSDYVRELAAVHNELRVVIFLKDQRQHDEAFRIRAQYQTQRLELSNRIREILAEFSSEEIFEQEEDELAYANEINEQMSDQVRQTIFELNREREVIEDQMRSEIAEVAEAFRVESQASLISRIESLGGEAHERVAIINAVSATIESRHLNTLATHPDIAEIAYDEPGAPELNQQKVSLGVEAFWNSRRFGTGLWDIGLLDTGVEKSHPALKANRFESNVPNSQVSFHGTGVACMYASNHSTYQGLAFGPKTIVVDDASDVASISMAGADWMLRRADNKPELINYSWGNGRVRSAWSPMARFVDAAVYDYDVAWVKSAGNHGFGHNTLSSPAENYNALTVGNVYDMNTTTRTDDGVDKFSSRGPTYDGRRKPDISAPGSATYTCNTGGKWHELHGTSSAAPKVGAGMLLLRDAGHWDPITMKAVLINTADSWEDSNSETREDDAPVNRKEWNKSYGWGYLDLSHANFHRNDYFYSDVYPRGQVNDYRLFKGRAFTGDKATLVWKRQVNYDNGQTPRSYRSLSDLDLYQFNESTNITEDLDINVRDNVHQVAAKSVGNKVIKVKSYSRSFYGVDSEPFALATEENFTTAYGPVFSTQIGAPKAVEDNATFIIGARIRNIGDLNAHHVNVTLKLPTYFTLVSGTATQNLDKLPKGASKDVTWEVQAPWGSVPITRTFTIETNSFSYQETFKTSATHDITLL